MEQNIVRPMPVTPALTASATATSALGSPRVAAATYADFGAFAGDLDR